MEDKKIAKAQYNWTPLATEHLVVGNYLSKRGIPGYFDGTLEPKYHDQLRIIRWYYINDAIAGTVVNRMADMAITQLRNRKKTKRNSDVVDDAIMAYYDSIALEIRPFLKQAALEYLLHGLVVPAYTTKRIMGNKIAEPLGRKRYYTIDSIWVRNPENIVLRKKPEGMERSIYLRIPREDVVFVQNKGKRNDGTADYAAYQRLVTDFPEYVRAIESGETFFLLDDQAIYRKLTSYNEYPLPFLTNALSSLQHKAYLKNMDKSIASRAIEAIRHIKVGSDEFPAQTEDIDDIKTMLQTNQSTGERIFNLFTNHTINIEWVMPPLDALLSEAKYIEPNNDIFLALGFPRVLTVGETAKSNSSDSKIASLGPKSTLEDLRESLINWVRYLYEALADANNFSRFPEPYFSPIATSDYTALVQFATDALAAGAISKNTISELYGSDYETEAAQIQSEQTSGIKTPDQIAKEQDQQFQLQVMDKQKDKTTI